MKQDHRWPRLIFEVLPLLVGAAALAVAGARWLAVEPSGMAIYAVAGLACLAFVVLQALREARGWNVALLGCASALGGAVVGVILPVSGARWWQVVSWSILAGCCGSVAGGVIGVQLIRLARPLWLLAWVYLAGWLSVVVGGASERWVETWGLAGVVVFAGLVGVRMAQWLGDVSDEMSSTAEAGGLLLLLANLLLATGVWTGAFSH